jgi:ribose 5-phosphate isomerase A
MITSDLPPIVKAKKRVGEAAAQQVKEGMVVGLGTGSTAVFFIHALALRCREGLKITAVATSLQSQFLAQQLGIPMVQSDSFTTLDLTVDGADEVDELFQIIKGGGGALMREKILAQSSREWVVIIDETKRVKALGQFPVPVEISPFGYASTIERLQQRGYQGKIRMENHLFFVTDNQNYIYDITFPDPIVDVQGKDIELRQISGVVETGFFYNKVSRLMVGTLDGQVVDIGPV